MSLLFAYSMLTEFQPSQQSPGLLCGVEFEMKVFNSFNKVSQIASIDICFEVFFAKSWRKIRSQIRRSSVVKIDFMQKFSHQKQKTKAVDNKFLIENVYTAMSTAQEIYRKATGARGSKLMGAYDIVNYSQKNLVELRNQLRVQLFSVTCGLQLFRQQHGEGQLKFSQKFKKGQMSTILQDYAAQVDFESRQLLLQFAKVIEFGKTEKPIELEKQTSQKIDGKENVSKVIALTVFSNKKEEEFNKQFEGKGRVNLDPNFNEQPESLVEIKGEIERVDNVEKPKSKGLQSHLPSGHFKHEIKEYEKQQPAKSQSKNQELADEKERWVSAIKVLKRSQTKYEKQREIDWICNQKEGKGKPNQLLRKKLILLQNNCIGVKGYRQAMGRMLKLPAEIQQAMLETLNSNRK